MPILLAIGFGLVSAGLLGKVLQREERTQGGNLSTLIMGVSVGVALGLLVGRKRK